MFVEGRKGGKAERSTEEGTRAQDCGDRDVVRGGGRCYSDTVDGLGRVRGDSMRGGLCGLGEGSWAARFSFNELGFLFSIVVSLTVTDAEPLRKHVALGMFADALMVDIFGLAIWEVVMLNFNIMLGVWGLGGPVSEVR